MHGSQTELSDGFHQPKNFVYSTILEFLDILVSSVIIAPCVIGYWRGTWELQGYILLPDQTFLSALTSFTIGIVGHLVFTFCQNPLKRTFDPDKHRLTYYLATRSYTYIYGVICVNSWRGAWILCDYLTTAKVLHIVVIVTAIAVLCLGLTRTVRNLIAAPFALAVDRKEDYFDVNTMFKIEGFKQPGLYILDSIFSVFIIGNLVVLAWRGVWVIFDLTLYPNSKPFSAWGSMVLGYGIVAIVFALQPIVRWMCDQIGGACQLIISDIFMIVTFIGTVNIWRGVWMLLDVYLYPDDMYLSNWISHIVCFTILTVLNCSNSILVRGVYIDAEEKTGDCVVFPIFFIRAHFQRERTKKHRRLRIRQDIENQNRLIVDKKLSIALDRTVNMSASRQTLDDTKLTSTEIKPMLNDKNSIMN